jgi:hypothetical protein
MQVVLRFGPQYGYAAIDRENAAESSRPLQDFFICDFLGTFSFARSV